MSKQLVRALALLVAMAFTQQAWGAVITTVPFEHLTRSTWAEVIEAESAAVTKSGSWSSFFIDPDPWDRGIWLFTVGSYLEAAFTTPADTLIVQFESDFNDGIAEFFVDGSSVGTLDTYGGGWFGVEISGLALAPHTLRVTAAGLHPGSTFADDVAVDVLGAKVSAVVPEPATIVLIGFGLVVLAAGLRRRQ